MPGNAELGNAEPGTGRPDRLALRAPGSAVGGTGRTPAFVGLGGGLVHGATLEGLKGMTLFWTMKGASAYGGDGEEANQAPVRLCIVKHRADSFHVGNCL